MRPSKSFDATRSEVLKDPDVAAAYLEALAEEADFDPCCGMSDDAIRASAATCDAIAGRMEAGNERDAREALTELGNKFGFKTPVRKPTV